MLFAQLTLILVFHRIKAIEIAREVEGGVELLSPGKIELILPEEPSFTIKSPGSFIGKAKMCYAAQTTINKKFGYHNHVEYCPPETCVLLISDEFRAHGLITERRGSVVHYQFRDFNDDMWCPRLVINSRQNFTILELPQAPLIVNGASLPKDEPIANARFSTKFIVIICVLLFFLILVVVIVVFCICMKLKKKPASVKHLQLSLKSRKSHCKASPAVVSPVSKKKIKVNSSNSANNIENI